MIDFITKYWIEVLFGAILTGLGTAFSFLSKRVSKRIEEQEAIKLGKMCIRDRYKIGVVTAVQLSGVQIKFDGEELSLIHI